MKVSICIPQYNRCIELRKVLEDLLQQTYPDFELLIVDDASTEDTAAVLKEFVDPRIRYIRNSQNLGLYPNFNRCVELAQGEYVAIYHNHDRYDRTIIEKSVRILDKHPEVGFVHTGTVIRSGDGQQERYFVRNWPKIMKGMDLIPHLIRRWDSPVHQPTVMARKIMYEKTGRYDDQTYSACADTPIWMKMCQLADVGYIPEALMQITPRIQADRYGKFEWKDVQGMARAHWLGFDIIYEHLPEKEYQRKRNYQQSLHDRHFLLWLAYVIVENKADLIHQSTPVFDDECSRNAQRTCKFFVWIGPYLQIFLLLGRRIYRQANRLKDRYENWFGEERSKSDQNRKELH